MNTSKGMYETIMKIAMKKCIDQGEYYTEDDNGPNFELSSDAKNYLRLVAKNLDGLCRLIDDEFKIYDTPDDM